MYRSCNSKMVISSEIACIQGELGAENVSAILPKGSRANRWHSPSHRSG